MNEINKIVQIPLEIRLEKKADDIILYTLAYFGPLMREEFINEPGSTNRINKNTFHKYANLLIRKNWIEKRKEGKKTVYNITRSGRSELSKRLKDYRLDFETKHKLQQKKIETTIKDYIEFLEKYDIKENEIKIEFIDLANDIPPDKLDFSFEKFYKLLLFLVLNHPKFYPEYTISKENFRKIYDNNFVDSNEKITHADLDYFLQEIIVKEKRFRIKFYKLKLKIREDVSEELYFRAKSEYGKIFRTIVEAQLNKLYYDVNLGTVKLNQESLKDTYECIMSILINKFQLFHEDLEEALYQLLNDYKDMINNDIENNALIAISKFKKYYPIASIDIPSIPRPKKDKIERDEKFKKLRLIQAEKLDKSNKYLQKANELVKKEKNLEALKEVEKSINFNPNSIQSYYLKATILLRKGWNFVFDMEDPFEEALSCVEKAYELNPKDLENFIDFITLQSVILLRMNRLKEGLEVLKLIEDIDTILDLDSDDFYYYEQTNYVHYQYYETKAKILLNLKKYDEALNTIEKDIELCGEDWEFSDSYEIKWRILFEKQEFHKALSTIKKAIDIDPNDFYLYENKVRTLMALNEFEEVLKVLDKVNAVFDSNKKDPGSYYQLYDVLVKELISYGYYEKTSKVIEKIIESESTDVYTLVFYFVNPIIRNINNHNYNEALRIINLVETFIPSYFHQSNLKIITYYGLKDYETALKLVNESIKISENLSSIQLFESFEPSEAEKIKASYGSQIIKAKILRDMGKFNESLKLLDDLIYVDPDNPEAHILKSLLFFIMGNYQNSLAAINTLIDLKPEILEYRKIKIEILFNINEYEESLNQIKKYLDEKPVDIDILNYGIQVYKKLKNQREATKLRQQLISALNNSKIIESVILECEQCGTKFKINRSDYGFDWPSKCFNKQCKAKLDDFKIKLKEFIPEIDQLKIPEVDE